MRIIDGNELYNIEKLLDTEVIQKSPTASWLLSQVLHDIQAQPEIDPESLPVVQQLRANLELSDQEMQNLLKSMESLYKQRDELRAELEKVKKERDAAVKALPIGRCKNCKHQGTGDSDICHSGMDEEFCSGFEPREEEAK